VSNTGRDLLDSDALKQAILDDLCGLAAEAKFITLEKPGQLYLMDDPFTIENEYLTPTMKMKRNIAKTKLASEIT
jgi:long-subunit acyl-CoA synthetase (AMP-forming)